jgi:hypothetical protein
MTCVCVIYYDYLNVKCTEDLSGKTDGVVGPKKMKRFSPSSMLTTPGRISQCVAFGVHLD